MKSLDLSIILKLVDKVTAPLKGVAGSFGKVKGSADQAIASISRFERVSTAVQRTTDRLRGMVAMAGKASAALATVGGIGGGAIATNAISVTADFEQMDTVLDTLYRGDKAQIGKAKGFLKDFMAESPFETASITEGFNRLKAYGIDPMDGSLKTMGDTAAAMGKDIMSAVEMMADAIMGENERLKEFGIKGNAIQGTDYIQYEYTDKNGIQQKLQVLKNDRQQIQRVLTQILNENYGGSSAKLAKTFKGLTSNTKDALNNLQMQFMNAGIFDFIKEGLASKLTLLNEFAKSGKVEAWGRKAAEFMKLATAEAGKLIDKVVETTTKIADFVGGWGNLGRITAGVVAGFSGWWVFGDLIKSLIFSISPLTVALSGAGAALWKWRDLLPGISRYFPKLGEWLGERLPAASEKLQGAWKALAAIWQEGVIGKGGALAKIIPDFLLPKPSANGVKAAAPDKNSAAGKASQALGVLVDGSIPKLEKFKKLSALAFGSSVVEKFGKAADWLALQLPKLEATVISVFGTVKQWVTGSGASVTSVLGGVAEKALGKFTTGLEWLSAKAKDGSVGRWLDLAASKIGPVMDNVMAFGRGVWETVLKIGKFTAKFAEFIGGWDKLAMVLAGGWVVAALSGFLQGLAALGGIMAFLLSPIGLLVALIAALAIGARYVYLEWDNMSTGSRVLAVALGALGVGILALVAYLKIAARWTAITAAAQKVWNAVLWLGRAAMVAFRAISLVGLLMALAASFTAAGIAAGIASAGTWLLAGAVAVLTSPITLVIGLIALLAAGAYYLYQNWDTIKPMLLAFWEDVKAAWETFKTWVSGLIDSVAQTFWAGWEKVKNYTVELANSIVTFFAELPAKMLEVGSNIINGLWDGLKNSATAVVDWMADFGSDIIDGAKGVLGINSPSRVFAEIGGFTVAGMQQGMETAQPNLFSFLHGFGDKLKGWWKDVADAFTGDDLAANIGKAFEITKNALPPAVVSGMEKAAALIPGVSTITAIGKAVAQVGKQSTVAGLIHWGESRQRGYNDYNRGSDKWSASNKQNIDLAQMTVGQIMAAQSLPRGHANRLFAVGKYQAIPETLNGAVSALGISLSEKFTPELQDKIFTNYLAAKKRPQIEQYIKGSGTLESASHAVAQEWASVASIKTGKGVYDGVGVNHTGIKAPEMAAALQNARAEYSRLISSGMSEIAAYAASLGASSPATSAMPPAIQDLRARAANDPLFAQALNKQSSDKTAAGESSTVVPFVRPAPVQPMVAPQQTISITINAGPGMSEQDIATKVRQVLRDEARLAEARYRGRVYD